MKKILVLSLLIQSFCLRATNLDITNSLIVSPIFKSTIATKRPVIVGIVKKSNNDPVKNKKVTIAVDNRKVGAVQTDDNGVWSYFLDANQALSAGIHMVTAVVELNENNQQYITSTAFTVSKHARSEIDSRSGNVSVANSQISFPHTGAYVNSTTPTVIGVLYSSTMSPVSGETVQVKIDSSTVGTVSSNSNGVYSYTLTSGQALSEASHTADAHCVETNVDLTQTSFVIDVTAPAAPVISAPTENQTVTNSLVTVSGTSEADATVITFLDGSEYGDFNYADGSGNWSVEYQLANGAHTVAAQAEDLAGNTGSMSGTRNFSVSA